MASCAIAKLTHGLTSRPASSCKRYTNPSSRWPSSFTPKPSRRSSLRLQCKARTLKHAEPLDATNLQERFGSENLQFSDVGGLTVIELNLGSVAAVRVLLHEARITSYKCRLWHGSTEEFLHTEVSEPASEITANGAASSLSSPQLLITGGIVPYLAYSLPAHLPLVEDKWLVDWVRVDPDEQVQVTLKHVDENENGGSGQFYLQCVITLTKDYLASCVVITNNDNKPMTFTGSITSHVAIRATEALCAAGLQGCKYYSPSEAARRLAMKKTTTKSLFGRLKQFVLRESNEMNQVENTVAEGTSAGNPYHDSANWFIEKLGDVVAFTNGVHKIYSEPSKKIRLNDQGFRRSLLLESYGFGNLEVSSPEQDGENPFVSVGCSSVLSPITLNPRNVWRGAQILCPDTK